MTFLDGQLRLRLDTMIYSITDQYIKMFYQDQDLDVEMLNFLISWIRNLYDQIEKKNLIIREQEEDVSRLQNEVSQLKVCLYGEPLDPEGVIKPELLKSNYKI